MLRRLLLLLSRYQRPDESLRELHGTSVTNPSAVTTSRTSWQGAAGAFCNVTACSASRGEGRWIVGAASRATLAAFAWTSAGRAFSPCSTGARGAAVGVRRSVAGATGGVADGAAPSLGRRNIA